MPHDTPGFTVLARIVINDTEIAVTEFQGAITIHQTDADVKWAGQTFSVEEPDTIPTIVRGLVLALRRHRRRERVLREMVKV